MRRSIGSFIKIIDSENKLDIPNHIDKITALYYILNEHIECVKIANIDDKFGFICRMIDESSKNDAINMNGSIFTLYETKLTIHSKHIADNTVSLVFTRN